MNWPVNPLRGNQTKPLTGEPCAGDPPARFGGGRGRHQSVLPTPILLAPGKRGLPPTFPWHLFSRPTPHAAGRELGSFSCSIPPSFVLSHNMPRINTMSNWLRLGAFLRGPAESTRRCADSTSRLHGDGYGCHAHAKSEHGEPWCYTIRGVSLAGMTSASLHARENASMPPRERHGRLGPIGKTGISITASSISSHSLTAVLVRLTTGHCSRATDHHSPVPRPTSGVRSCADPPPLATA